MGDADKAVIGAVVKDASVVHVHQRVFDRSSVLDEDRFFESTGLRLSWPARVAVVRLLQEDVLLQDVRTLIHIGELSFEHQMLVIAEKSSQLSEERLQRISDAVAKTNEDLQDLLDDQKPIG